MIQLLLLWLAAGQDDAIRVEDIPPPPSLELLEFLGRYEDEEGKWLDPMALEYALDGHKRDATEELEDADDGAAEPADHPRAAARHCQLRGRVG